MAILAHNHASGVKWCSTNNNHHMHVKEKTCNLCYRLDFIISYCMSCYLYIWLKLFRVFCGGILYVGRNVGDFSRLLPQTRQLSSQYSSSFFAETTCLAKTCIILIILNKLQRNSNRMFRFHYWLSRSFESQSQCVKIESFSFEFSWFQNVKTRQGNSNL